MLCTALGAKSCTTAVNTAASCLTGFYGTTSCIKCISNTVECSSATVFTCADGYSKIGTDTKCSKCPVNAKKCINNSLKASECNTGYIITSNGVCIQCTPGALTCSAPIS